MTMTMTMTSYRTCMASPEGACPTESGFETVPSLSVAIPLTVGQTSLLVELE